MKLKQARTVFSLLIIGLVINLIGAVFFHSLLQHHENIRLQKTELQQQSFLNNTADILDSRLHQIANLADGYADSLSSGKYSLSQLNQQITTNRFWLNPGVVGIGLAYIPQKNNNQHLKKSIYWQNLGTKIESLPYDINYTHAVQGNNWFNDVVKSPGKTWSKPYYDSSLKQFIFSYSVPIYNQNNKLQAILVVDLDLQIIDNIVSQYIGEKYATIVAADGSYIYDGDVNKILNRDNLLTSTHDTLDRDVYQKIRLKQCSQICKLNLQSSNDAYLVLYKSLNHLPWIIFADYNNQQFKKLNRSSNNALTMLYIGCCTGIAIFGLLLINLYRTRNKMSIRVLWQCSILVTLVLVTAIVLLWKISDNLYYRDTSGAITNKTILDNYINEYDHSAKLKGLESTIKIPTSITVDSVEFLNSYNIQLTGHIMQRYPKDSESIQGIKFNNSFDSKISKISEKNSNRYNVVTWAFQVKIRERFDYTHYPFNHGNIWLEVSPVTQQQNILMIPDFSYYNSLTDINSANGIDEKLIIPGWNIRGSYFNYHNDSSRMLNKINSYETVDLPALTFNILIGATLSDAIITTIIPPVVIILILFITLLTISKRKNRFIEFKVASILGSSSGMLFTIVFTHVSLRNKLTANIMYIEYFYLLMYIAVLIIPINAFLYATHKHRWINYGNNLLLKLLFLPLIAAIFLTISLWRFS